MWEYPRTRISYNVEGSQLWLTNTYWKFFFQQLSANAPQCYSSIMWHSSKCNINFKPVSNRILKHSQRVIFQLDWNCKISLVMQKYQRQFKTTHTKTSSTKKTLNSKHKLINVRQWQIRTRMDWCDMSADNLITNHFGFL